MVSEQRRAGCILKGASGEISGSAAVQQPAVGGHLLTLAFEVNNDGECLRGQTGRKYCHVGSVGASSTAAHSPYGRDSALADLRSRKDGTAPV